MIIIVKWCSGVACNCITAYCYDIGLYLALISMFSAQEINQYRGMLGNLFNYDTLSVPLVYTQVSPGHIIDTCSAGLGRHF